jgi:hypothetical protein
LLEEMCRRPVGQCGPSRFGRPAQTRLPGKPVDRIRFGAPVQLDHEINHVPARGALRPALPVPVLHGERRVLVDVAWEGAVIIGGTPARPCRFMAAFGEHFSERDALAYLGDSVDERAHDVALTSRTNPFTGLCDLGGRSKRAQSAGRSEDPPRRAQTPLGSGEVGPDEEARLDTFPCVPSHRSSTLSSAKLWRLAGLSWWGLGRPQTASCLPLRCGA